MSAAMRRDVREFVQPYMEALRERMIMFGTDELDKLRTAMDNEFDDVTDPTTVFPEAPVRHQITSVTLSDEGLLGTSLAGAEIFEIPKSQLPETVTAATLMELAAGAMGVMPNSLTLWEGGSELVGAAVLGHGVTTLRETIADSLRPVVCRKGNQAHDEVSLGEGMRSVDFESLPQDGAIQAISERRNYVTFAETCWLIYTRKEVVSFNFTSGQVLDFIGFFPPSPCWKLPMGTRRWGGEMADVWSVEYVELSKIRPLLDKHAAATNDRPIPRYQMIVDPNQFVTGLPNDPVWVPCDVDVAADGSVTLVGGPVSHAEPQLAQEVVVPVLTAALPLLAKLRRPQLLLDDRRLQVVFKAQRILVPGSKADGADSEYVGLWHVDGHRERVAAVVLYYYHVDPKLRGGDMEFCGREPMDILGIGDCSNNFEDFGRDSLKVAFRDEKKVSNCRVPIREGTLLVFSNYQMAHRVLRMVNTGPEEASRDFVALFILDPAFPPLRSAPSVLAHSYLMLKVLSACGLSQSDIANIQEFSGDRQRRVHLKLQRNAMLREQLRPTGEFCGGAQVHTAGNGCYTMIGWLHHLLERDDFCLNEIEEDVPEWHGGKFLKALNLPPKEEGRGLSEILSLGTSEVDRRLQDYGEQAEVFDD